MTSADLRIGGLIFGSLKKIGGYEIFIYNLFRLLSGRGHHVDLYISRQEYTQHSDFYHSLPFSVKPLFFKTKGFARHLPSILKAYLAYQNKKNRYDVWQVVGSFPAGYLASSLSGKVPLILRTHGDDVQKDVALDYGLRLDSGMEQKILDTLHKMDRVIALSESITECYRELEIPEHKIAQIPNGIDFPRFNTPSDQTRTRQQWDLPLDRPLILTVGRNHPKKGYAIIPEVARSLKCKGTSFLWLVVGHNTEQLIPLIEQHGVGDVVRTVGEIGVSERPDSGDEIRLPADELVRLYQCADIFAFPSRLESFGRVLIEAMAAGLPVVTTDAPGCRHVVEHGVTGLQTSPDDVQGMAAHLQSLIDHENLREQLIANGRQCAKQYDWEVVADRYEHLYRTLLTEGR